MNILFVSDIHIDFSKNLDWEKNRVDRLFKILSEVNYDKIVLGGDIFNRANPSLEELNTFYRGVQLLHDVIIIAGNHEDVATRINTFTYLPELGFKYYSTGVIETDTTDLYFCSHSHLSYLTTIRNTLKNKKSILFTHVRCNVPPYIKEEYDIRFLSNAFDLVIAGDIHQPIEPYKNVKYPGQPFASRFNTEVKHQYFMIDTDTLYVEAHELFLPTKIKVTLPLDAISNYPFKKENLYKVVVKGTIEELHQIPPCSSNISFEKTITTNKETDETTIINTKLDVENTLLETTKKMYSLSETVMEQGRKLVQQITGKKT